MALVPICYKMSFKNQCLLRSNEVAQNEKDFCFAKRCFYSINGNTRNNMLWCLRFDSGDTRQNEKRCLARDAYKSKSVEKQLKSLDAYFKKLLLNDANEYFSVSTNKNEEFSEQGGKVNGKSAQGSVENYLGKVSKDGNFVSFASSTSVDTTKEEVNLTGSSSKGDWKKLKNYVKIKGEDNSEISPNESSDLFLIGILFSINIAVFLFEIASPVQNSEMELFSLPSIYGAKINHLIQLGEWWRLVTPMFLHSGIFHIGLGSCVLLSFGPRVCKAYGSFTFLLIYILGGVSGNLISFLQTPDPTVGGTGPVFAVMGAWLIYQFQNKDVIEKNDSENMFRKAIVAIAISFILSNFGPIDDWTHFGAILTGILYGYLTCPMLQMDDKIKKSSQQERIGLVRRYRDPWISVLVFSLFVVVLSSLLFIFEPPVNYLGFL